MTRSADWKWDCFLSLYSSWDTSISARVNRSWVMYRKSCIAIHLSEHGFSSCDVTSQPLRGPHKLTVNRHVCIPKRSNRFAFTEARWPIRDGDRVVRGRESERLDRGNRPKKTGETVDRRQNYGSVKAVSPRGPLPSDLCAALHNCSFNCCAGQSH